MHGRNSSSVSASCRCRSLATLVFGCGWLTLTGCQTLAQQPFTAEPATPPNPVVQVSAEEATLGEKTSRNVNSALNFVTGREQVNPARAKELYREGDALFKQASKNPRENADLFEAAARKFQSAGEASPKSATEEDALFMQAESLFFADRLMEAADTYQKLQKDFPRNRHIDRAAARLFAISRYWADVAKAQDGRWFTLNLFDPKRPRLDVDGHAIRVLDQIRYDNPTGRLADDATMAAAAEFIRQEKFDQADEFLTDLRETFSDSEHLFHAHMLGIRCKLETYAGPRYSGLVLEEAETLIRQTRERFPDKMAEQEYADMVARATAEVAFHRADRLAYRADYREKRKEFGAARYYYNELLKTHGDTPHAEKARTRLAQIEKLPAVPPTRLSWLTTLFPDSTSKDPLQMADPNQKPSTEDAGQNKTILR